MVDTKPSVSICQSVSVKSIHHLSTYLTALGCKWNYTRVFYKKSFYKNLGSNSGKFKKLLRNYWGWNGIPGNLNNWSWNVKVTFCGSNLRKKPECLVTLVENERRPKGYWLCFAGIINFHKKSFQFCLIWIRKLRNLRLIKGEFEEILRLTENSISFK